MKAIVILTSIVCAVVELVTHRHTMNACLSIIETQKPLKQTWSRQPLRSRVFKQADINKAKKKLCWKMRRIRTSLFGRHQGPPPVGSAPESEPLMEHCDIRNHPGGPAPEVLRVNNFEATEQQAQSLASADHESRLFALRHLSRALTTLAHGILRLEYAGLYIEAFGLRNVWDRMLTDYVRSSDAVDYEPATREFDANMTREQHSDEALDKIGMALVMAEATMARWEWVPMVEDLRWEVENLYVRFGRRIPDVDG